MRDFTFRAKYMEVASKIPDLGQRAAFLMAVVEYGSTGNEPSLSWPLDAIFAAVREEIDYSVAVRQEGSKGGRPKGSGKKPANEVSENPKTGVSETQKGGFPKPENPPFENSETHNITEHSNTGHCNTGASAPAMEPPSVDEVVGYAQCQTLSVPNLRAEADRFVNHFAAQGWVRGNGMPVRDWRPLWAKWVSERSSFARGQPDRAGGGEHARELGERYGEAGRTEEVR